MQAEVSVNGYRNRLERIINLSYESAINKINAGSIVIENEASFQLQLSSIIKNIGDLFVYKKEEIFNIELEKPVFLEEGLSFYKSKSDKASIDIFISLENLLTKARCGCAIELKYFKKSNHREPNNRYDVFKDLKNLETYNKNFNSIDFGVFIIGTDHEHYVNQEKNYSLQTGDFDFRHGKSYIKENALEYKTDKPYGPSIKLDKDYKFEWEKFSSIYFMKLFIK